MNTNIVYIQIRDGNAIQHEGIQPVNSNTEHFLLDSR